MDWGVFIMHFSLRGVCFAQTTAEAVSKSTSIIGFPYAEHSDFYHFHKKYIRNKNIFLSMAALKA